MPPAARVADATNHPGILMPPGVPTVLIAGLPAATLGNLHTCTMPPLAGPHPPSVIVRGSATVLIGGRPAARLGDMAGCGAMIVSGAMNVLIGG
ncbi:MAG: PAAR domain-containing protein [Actinomycetota bacterium]|nr:PAAR domain-containing protein [Actinomycetota bacterium]